MSDGVEAWDTHLHVIGDRAEFPLSPSRGYEPPDAPLEALIAHLDRMKMDRGVLVQPSVYGFDNSCLLDALRRSDGRCRGGAVPPPGTERATLAAMHVAGVRGVRCNLVNPGGLELGQSRPWWPWMRDHGWHLVLQIDATRVDCASLLEPGMPPVVVDHMGYPPRGATPCDIADLVAAVGRGDLRVKLSAPYRISAEPPPYSDAQALARALLAAEPAQCLLATDWPHTEMAAPPMPDEEWIAAVRTLAGANWEAMCRAAGDLYGG